MSTEPSEGWKQYRKGWSLVHGDYIPLGAAGKSDSPLS